MTARRFSALLLTLGLGLLWAAPAANAHRALVAAPGDVSVDLGRARDDHALHSTLIRPGDRIDATLTPGPDGLVHVELLVPQPGPEAASPPADRPAGRLIVGGEELPVPALASPQEVTDPATGLVYLAYARLEHVLEPAARRTPLDLQVLRGDSPSRVVLRTGPGPLHLTGAADVPRTVARLRAWHDDPPVAAPAREQGMPLMAVAAAGLAASMLLLATWWVRTGRSRARRRSHHADAATRYGVVHDA